MTKATYEKGVHKCRKCGNRAPFNEDEGIYRCIVCGHEEQELRAFYQFCEKNKKEIIQDILDIGLIKAREKWRISFVAWRYIYKHWGLRRVWAAPGFHSRSENGHRKLPAFRHDWPDEIKLKWLEAYQTYLEVIER